MPRAHAALPATIAAPPPPRSAACSGEALKPRSRPASSGHAQLQTHMLTRCHQVHLRPRRTPRPPQSTGLACAVGHHPSRVRLRTQDTPTRRRTRRTPRGSAAPGGQRGRLARSGAMAACVVRETPSEEATCTHATRLAQLQQHVTCLRKGWGGGDDDSIPV